MGAVPKYRINKAKRGKRRRGNTKKITKKLQHAAVPKHKKGFVAQMFRKIGVDFNSQ